MTSSTQKSVPIEQLPRIVAELQARAQAQEDEKFVKAQSDVTIKAFERSTSYSNVILVAGYAGAFTIWSFTKSQLSDKSSIVIALSLLISLIAFIVFEVVKMTLTGNLINKKIGVFKSSKTIADQVKVLKEIDEANGSIMAAFRWYWFTTMLITVVSAGIALGVLTYNFVAVLVGWPRWPS